MCVNWNELLRYGEATAALQWLPGVRLPLDMDMDMSQYGYVWNNTPTSNRDTSPRVGHSAGPAIATHDKAWRQYKRRTIDKIDFNKLLPAPVALIILIRENYLRKLLYGMPLTAVTRGIWNRGVRFGHHPFR